MLVSGFMSVKNATRSSDQSRVTAAFFAPTERFLVHRFSKENRQAAASLPDFSLTEMSCIRKLPVMGASLH